MTRMDLGLSYSAETQKMLITDLMHKIILFYVSNYYPMKYPTLVIENDLVNNDKAVNNTRTLKT